MLDFVGDLDDACVFDLPGRGVTATKHDGRDVVGVEKAAIRHVCLFPGAMGAMPMPIAPGPNCAPIVELSSVMTVFAGCQRWVTCSETRAARSAASAWAIVAMMGEPPSMRAPHSSTARAIASS